MVRISVGEHQHALFKEKFKKKKTAKIHNKDQAHMLLALPSVLNSHANKEMTNIK